MYQEFSLGEWIERRRRALGITQDVLAQQVGYSVAMIRKIENDERRPSIKGAALLAKALEIPEDMQDAFLKTARQARIVEDTGILDRDEIFPWQTPSQPQTNIPIPATLFVGRMDELEKVVELLQDSACRLVTLVGMAGIGKTRLALQVAHSLLDQYPNGVFFVSLDSLSSPEMIPATIADAIGFHFHEAAVPQEQLIGYIREKQMLFVLDGFEHLTEGADLLSTMLQISPGVQFLVTSRERLNLQGEWILELGGLLYPESLDGWQNDQMEAYSAVQLFLQGALRVDPRFNLNDENLKWVVRICQLTEGIPLAVELASAWVRALPCHEIAREIETNLDFLKSSARDIPQRQRSLRAALDYSWNLLSNREREVFKRLSVFHGGFRREAAQSVAEASLEELTSLLDKSMLKRVEEDRYTLHELVRHYAMAHLMSEPQEYAQTRERHSSYYAALLNQWEAQIRSPRQMEILAGMEDEIENVRHAWSWMVNNQQLGDIRKSLRSLWQFHEIRGRFQEGAALFGQAVVRLRTADEVGEEEREQHSAVLGQVMAIQGYFNAHLGKHEEAGRLLQESLVLLRSTPDQGALANGLAYLGYMKFRQEEYTEARRYAQESLRLNRALDNQVGVVACLVTLSFISLAQEAYRQAYQLSSESLGISRDLLGDPHGISDSLITLSAAASHLGKYAEAKKWAKEGLRISRKLNDHWNTGQTLRQLGLISLELGELNRAEALLRQSISQFREICDISMMAAALLDLGTIMRVSGAHTEAKRHFLEALRAAAEIQSTAIVLQALTELAVIEMNEGSSELALELVASCIQQSATDPAVQELARRLRSELMAQLPPHQVEAAEDRAHTKTLETLAKEVLAAV